MTVPRVSVVIPAYYSHGTLTECLAALRAQTYRDFETVLVNSSDETITASIVSSEFPEVLFDQSPSRLYPHAARNRGVQLAQGELLVFTDPDCRARPDWLQRLVTAHDEGHPVVGGAMELASDDWFERGVHLTKFSWALSGLPPAPHWICPSANVLYTRRVFDEIGPLDAELFCGDAVLSWRARAAHAVPWFEPTAVVEHRHEGDIASFWRQQRRRGTEFAEARTAFEGWSRMKAIMMVFLMPALIPLTLLRTGRDAVRGGWAGACLSTLPVQLAGQVAWCASEALVHARIAVRGIEAPSRTRGNRDAS